MGRRRTARSNGRKENGLTTLQDPVRRALFAHLAGEDRPVDRDSAASALGIGRALAAFHLDKLVRSGLVGADYGQGSAGGGPGRPRKLYRRLAEFSLSIPARNYALISGILSQAIASRWRLMGPHVAAAAQARGAAEARELAPVRGGGRRALPVAIARKLDSLGYGARVEGQRVTLRNCPYKALADQDGAHVCDVNRSFLDGFAHALGAGVRVVAVERGESGCCGELVVNP